MDYLKYKHRTQFIFFVEQLRRQTLKELRKLQKPRLYKLKEYQKICRKITEMAIKSDGLDITNRGFHKMNVDHIIPIYYGWKNNISPYLIGMSSNLQLISYNENKAKGRTYKLLPCT